MCVCERESKYLILMALNDGKKWRNFLHVFKEAAWGQILHYSHFPQPNVPTSIRFPNLPTQCSAQHLRKKRRKPIENPKWKGKRKRKTCNLDELIIVPGDQSKSLELSSPWHLKSARGSKAWGSSSHCHRHHKGCHWPQTHHSYGGRSCQGSLHQQPCTDPTSLLLPQRLQQTHWSTHHTPSSHNQSPLLLATEHTSSLPPSSS